MSFLLDALGKADTDRRLSEVPELSSRRQTAAVSPWLLALKWLALLLLAALLFLAGYLARPMIEAKSSSVEVLPASEVKMKPVQTPEMVVPTQTIIESVQNSQHKLSVISYSDLPAVRFAMINGFVTHEGDVLATGEKIMKIEKQAVVLEKSGAETRLVLGQ